MYDKYLIKTVVSTISVMYCACGDGLKQADTMYVGFAFGFYLNETRTWAVSQSDKGQTIDSGIN